VIQSGNQVDEGVYSGMSRQSLITSQNGGLVDAEGLIQALFAPECRPTIRWVRQMQAQRKIPYLKIGHLVRFDIAKVKATLNQNCSVSAR
jgi:hypothetical protein